MTAPTSAPRFRYPLDAFLKKHRWEEQGLRQELSTAREALVRLQEQSDALAKDVLALNGHLTLLRKEGAFDLARQQRLIAYRDEQETLVRNKQGELAEAQATFEQISQHLGRTMNAVRGHEGYRERLAGEHRQLSIREDARRVDDDWLLRKTWLGSQP